MVFHVMYKNVGTGFFRFVTITRLTDGRTDSRRTCISLVTKTAVHRYSAV